MNGGVFETVDGCRLAYVDEGHGMPVLWQHGLGADRDQPREVFPSIEGIRRITLECRGHGASELGDVNAISIARFADDVLALLDHLRIERAVIGGISLGAAIALRLAVLHPQRVDGLILARPAWIDEDGPERPAIYREVADLIAEYGCEEGAKRFEDSHRLHEIEQSSRDNAASMRSFFQRRNPASTIALLGRIPQQGPGVSRASIAALDTRALVIANGEDFVHSVDTARTLHELIPGARFRLITSKAVSRVRYVEEFRQALSAFLEELRA